MRTTSGSLFMYMKSRLIFSVLGDVAVVRERPQAAWPHLLQAGTAEGARLGLPPAIRE
jgi:hypothetical protein